MAQVGKERKVPQRKCIACSERGDKKQLMRIVKNKDGEVFIDPTGKANGRGAYIHLSEDCLNKAIKNHLLERSFKASVPKELFDQLKEELLKIEK